MTKQNQQVRNRVAARKLKEQIARQLKAGAGKGAEAAVRFLAARIKEAVSVPAPKKAIRALPLPGKKLGPILGYRATTPAVKDAPPRVVSGKLRQGLTTKMLSPTKGVVGVHARAVPTRKYPAGFNYPKHHELGSKEQWGGGEHRFIKPTVEKYRKELRVLAGAKVMAELRKK